MVVQLVGVLDEPAEPVIPIDQARRPGGPPCVVQQLPEPVDPPRHVGVGHVGEPEVAPLPPVVHRVRRDRRTVRHHHVVQHPFGQLGRGHGEDHNSVTGSVSAGPTTRGTRLPVVAVGPRTTRPPIAWSGAASRSSPEVTPGPCDVHLEGSAPCAGRWVAADDGFPAVRCRAAPTHAVATRSSPRRAMPPWWMVGSAAVDGELVGERFSQGAVRHVWSFRWPRVRWWLASRLTRRDAPGNDPLVLWSPPVSVTAVPPAPAANDAPEVTRCTYSSPTGSPSRPSSTSSRVGTSA